MKGRVEPAGGSDEDLCGQLDGNTSWEWTIPLWIWSASDEKLKKTLDWQDQWARLMHGKLPHLMGFIKGEVPIDEYTQLHKNTKQLMNETSQIMGCENNKQLIWIGP